MKIDKNIGINKLINEYPDVIPVLMSYGLHCVGCAFAQHDTLEQGAKIHGIQGNDFEMMIKDVNETIRANKEEKE